METVNQSIARGAIRRADGVTPSERYLKRLCEKSFLSLWSYPGVYRDQAKRTDLADGKEVCDLLAVFGDHIIIFSDKECGFPETGDLGLDWSRWFRRAVEKSAHQVWGAERWIRNSPERLFIDRACRTPLPIDLPSTDRMLIHRVVVAHSSSQRCSRELGGSGSLMIIPSITGPDHYSGPAMKPFAVGWIDRSKGYVHVLDDTSLDILMGTLDTVTDFVRYLCKKEILLESDRLVGAAGEEELLAWYLMSLRSDREHDFVIPPGHALAFIKEGHWKQFQRKFRKHTEKANAPSYSWDLLIERFSRNLLEDTQHFASHPRVPDQEQLLRYLAREPRIHRRMLANALLQLIERTPPSRKAVRVVFPLGPGQPYYVFLLLPEYDDLSYDDYRTLRRNLGYAYCMAVKLRFPDVEDIVCIATEPGPSSRAERSEDAMYYDARSWTEAELTEARELQAELQLLETTTLVGGTESEFVAETPGPVRAAPKVKGRARNRPCECGSGRKSKRCCLAQLPSGW